MSEQRSGGLGALLRQRRQALALSIYEVGRRAGIDRAVVFRIETGFIHSPDPRKLARLAGVLDLPAADLFSLAGYDSPRDLPSFKPYLRSRYGDLPSEAIHKLERYFRRVQHEYGATLDGPIDREDEEPE